MLEQIVNSPNFNYLPRGMSAASLRQEVISNNIANVNTPGFKRSVVEFEDFLARELHLQDGKDDGVVMRRTHDKHFSSTYDPLIAQPRIEQDDTSRMRLDGNNVDIDAEMAALAKDQLYYNALAAQFGTFLGGMREAMNAQ